MFVNLPNFCQSTDFDASNDRNCDEPSYHNRWLKYIGPHHGFQSALIKKKTKQTNNTNQKKTNVCVIRRFIHMHLADSWFYDGYDDDDVSLLFTYQTGVKCTNHPGGQDRGR